MRGKIGKRSSQALSTKAPNHPRSRKTLPCSKGIETFCQSQVCVKDCVERPCPVLKGLRLMENSLLETDSSRKTPPCFKGIETLNEIHPDIDCRCRKTPPCSKGIETRTLPPLVEENLSKDPALFQRD